MVLSGYWVTLVGVRRGFGSGRHCLHVLTNEKNIIFGGGVNTLATHFNVSHGPSFWSLFHFPFSTLHYPLTLSSYVTSQVDKITQRPKRTISCLEGAIVRITKALRIPRK